jgi:hypothetical protein
MYDTITIRTTERHRAAGTEVEIEREFSIDLPARDAPLPPLSQVEREAPPAFRPTPQPTAAPRTRPRFERQADGTVLDRELGLRWSRTLTDTDGDAERLNFAAAEKACAALGDGWRLPTRRELASLIDDTRHEPAIDVEAFPDTKPNYYWTSTPAAWSPSSPAWLVGFGYGYAGGNHRDGDAFVRAVRSVSAAPAPGQ